MGNAMIFPCCASKGLRASVKLIFWEGSTKTLTRKILAGELMFQFPNMVVCHANSFYIGHPVPALSIDDKLLPGETYFLLPIDLFACKILTISSISSLVTNPKPSSTINYGQEGPFQYVNCTNGGLLVKVSPEFLTKLISQRIVISNNTRTTSAGSDDSFCCNSIIITTPELKQHYDLLVGHCKEHVWSPNLDTISERRRRSSQVKVIGSGGS